MAVLIFVEQLAKNVLLFCKEFWQSLQLFQLLIYSTDVYPETSEYLKQLHCLEQLNCLEQLEQLSYLDQSCCMQQSCYYYCHTTTDEQVHWESCLQCDTLSFARSTAKTPRLAVGMIIIIVCCWIHLLKFKALEVEFTSSPSDHDQGVINLTAGRVPLIEIECTSFVGGTASKISYKDSGLQTMPRLRFSIATYLKRVPKLSLQAAGMEILVSVKKRYLILCYTFFSMTGRGGTIPYPMELKKRAKREAPVFNIPLHGSPNKGYCAMIAIGTENIQKFCVLVDTGSYNLAIAAAPHPSIDEHFNIDIVDKNFQNLGTKVSVSYTGGEWSGTLARDMISIVDSQNASQPIDAEFALIESSKDFFISGTEWEGIMGLAYSSLAKPDSSVESYWDSFRRRNTMNDIFSLKICPPRVPSSLSSGDEQGGELVLGGYHSRLYTGSIFYTSIVKEEYYNVLITNISIGGIQVKLDCKQFNNDRTIVDSGTTDVYLPTKAFNAVHSTFLEYFKNLLNFDIPELFWKGESKLAWPSDDLPFVYTCFPTVYIAFASHENETQEFSLGVTPQIYLRQVEGSVDERKSSFCQPRCTFFIFGIKSRKQGSIIGGNAMLGFATIFDRESGRIGFAASTCQYQDQSNGSTPHIVGPYHRDPIDCECYNCSASLSWVVYLSIACIVVATVCTSISVTITIACKRGNKCHSKTMSVCSWWPRKKYHRHPGDHDTEEAYEEAPDNITSSSSISSTGASANRAQVIFSNGRKTVKKVCYHILNFIIREKTHDQTEALIDSEAVQCIEEESSTSELITSCTSAAIHSQDNNDDQCSHMLVNDHLFIVRQQTISAEVTSENVSLLHVATPKDSISPALEVINLPQESASETISVPQEATSKDMNANNLSDVMVTGNKYQVDENYIKLSLAEPSPCSTSGSSIDIDHGNSLSEGDESPSSSITSQGSSDLAAYSDSLPSSLNNAQLIQDMGPSNISHSDGLIDNSNQFEIAQEILLNHNKKKSMKWQCYRMKGKAIKWMQKLNFEKLHNKKNNEQHTNKNIKKKNKSKNSTSSYH